VLTLHRRVPELKEAQARAEWRFIRPAEPASVCVGVLGLGNLGQHALRAVGRLGFRLAGWSKSRKSLDGIACFTGPDELAKFLGGCDIIVSLLPLTPETQDMIDSRLFAMMPSGAAFVSLGRGATVVDEDLIAALDSGQLRHAVLDVFRSEPLPPSHRFWRHPKITITPHNSSTTSPATAAPGVVADIRRALRGEPVLGRVDPVRGY
jgi:glyoxylate/hydroxypyruvate reductase A